MIERAAVGIDRRRLLDYLPAADCFCLTERVLQMRIFAAIFAMQATAFLRGGGKM